MKRILSGLITFSCFAIAGILLFYTFKYWHQYYSANKTYDEMKISYTEDEKGGKGKWKKINWKKLKKQNPDIVGWIYMSSGADYPIVQGKSNNQYIHTDPYGDYSINGSIMLNCYNKNDFTDKHNVIYGHNMRNGSMFGSNKKYREKKYANKHKNFYIFTPKGRFTYKIYQTHTVVDATDIYRVEFSDDKDFKDWLEKNKKTINLKIGKQATSEDKIMTLSTCMQDGDNRFVIQGYLKEFETYDHKTVKEREELQERFNEIRTDNKKAAP